MVDLLYYYSRVNSRIRYNRNIFFSITIPKCFQSGDGDGMASLLSYISFRPEDGYDGYGNPVSLLVWSEDTVMQLWKPCLYTVNAFGSVSGTYSCLR